MPDEILATIELDESPIPPGCVRNLNEVRVKNDGQIWDIHKYDDDPHPSNPHAHNKESGLKLDLSTGILYFKRDPQPGIGKKKLLEIREKAAAKNVVLPDLAC